MEKHKTVKIIMVTLKSLKRDQLLKIITHFDLQSKISQDDNKNTLIKAIQTEVSAEALNQFLSDQFNTSPNTVSRKAQKETASQFTFTQEMYNELLSRISTLEDHLGFGKQAKPSDIVRKLTQDEILSSIKAIIQKDPSGNRWVTLDNFFDYLHIYGSEREIYDKIILNLYYDEKIELAEGSTSQYRIKVRGSEFGRISLRKN